MGALRYYVLSVSATAVATVAVAYLLRGRRKTDEQRERERRERLSMMGRITDGTVLDVQEIAANGHGATQFIFYRYDVAGVSYEASQDITHLRQFVDIHSCKIGLPTSVKYDPHNPGNSIVIAERWKGLRQ